MRGHRMSSLPIVRFCGPAGELSSVSSGRAAVTSTAFHALCSGDPSAKDLIARLTDEERAQVAAWKKPTDIVLDADRGVVLRYSEAITEYEVAIDEHCNRVVDTETALSVGHVDMHWLLRFPADEERETGWAEAERRVVYVVDMKRSEWTVLDGPESLQLHAYGLALAAEYEADAYVPGIWAAMEGLWSWGDEVVMGSARSLDIARRVVAAAGNTSREFSTGPHCSGCWGRLHCPAYILPPELIGTSLAPFTGGAELTSEHALEMLSLIERGEDVLKLAKDELKERVRRGLEIVANGKRWAPVAMPGRTSLDLPALEAEYGKDAIERFQRRGKGYDQFRWVKA